MAKALAMKMRARMALGRRIRSRVHRLRELEELAETGLPPQAIHEIDAFERHQANVKRKELAFLKGRPTELAVQDFIGAALGAMFFVVTQEVWDLTARMQLWQLSAVAAISIFISFSLVYFSRRRRFLSEVAYRTMALRGLEIYIISLVTSGLLITIFGTAAGAEVMKQSIVIALPATVSAATADLLFY